MQGGIMSTPRSMCSIHQVVEVFPGMWKRDRALTRSQRSNHTFTEAACPTCLQVAREAFQQQFPALYTSAAALASRKSA
jgi:hypothetical protein